MDPVTIISTISSGLTLIDKFRTLTLKVLNREGAQPSVHAQERGGALEIERNGHVLERINASSLKMSAWDDKRYKTLQKKVSTNWDVYNDIDAELPSASTDEKARLKAKMASIRGDLCADFREMLALYEKTLGVTLGDHYSLYSVCGASQ